MAFYLFKNLFYEKNHKKVVTLGQLSRKSGVFLFMSCHLKYCWAIFPILCHTRGWIELGKFSMYTCCICHNNHLFYPRQHVPEISDKAELYESLHLRDRGIMLGGKRQQRAHRVSLKRWFVLVLSCVLSSLWVWEWQLGTQVVGWHSQGSMLRYADQQDIWSAANFSMSFSDVSIYDLA